jgi:5'(3')-deoxyribonucleotidase
MKLLLENWRKFLNEEVQDKYQIFLDMDGVLVDMTEGVVDTVNTNLQKVRNGASTDHMDPDSVHPGSKSKSRSLKRLVKEMEKEGREEITAAEFDHLTDLKDDPDEDFSGANKQIERYFLTAASANQDWWANLPGLPHAQTLVDLANEASHDGKAMILSAPIDDASIAGKKAWIENNLSGIDLDKVNIVHDKGEFLKKLQLPDNIIPILIDDRVKYHKQFSAAGGRVIPWNIHDPVGSLEKTQRELNSIIKNPAKDYSKQT